jgi:hypothetical protein
MGIINRGHQLLLIAATTLAALKSLDETVNYFRNRARKEEKPPEPSKLIVIERS